MTPKVVFNLLVLLVTVPRTLAQSSSPQVNNGPQKSPKIAKKSETRNIDDIFRSIKQQVETHSGSAYQVTYPVKGYSWHHINGYGNFQMDKSCVLQFDQTYQNNARTAREMRYSIALWDLASARYEIDRGSKQFTYDPGVPALFLRSRTKSMHWTRPRTYIATDLVEIEFGRDSNFGEAQIRNLGKDFMVLERSCAAVAPKNPSGAASESTKPGAPK